MSRSRPLPVHYEDFIDITQEHPRYSKRGNIFILKVAEDKEYYFAKKIGKDRLLAEHEVIAQEYLRLHIPRQPEYQIIQDKEGYFYVLSKGIQGFRHHPSGHVFLLSHSYGMKPYDLKILASDLKEDYAVGPHQVVLYLKDNQFEFVMNTGKDKKRFIVPSDKKEILEDKLSKQPVPQNEILTLLGTIAKHNLRGGQLVPKEKGKKGKKGKKKYNYLFEGVGELNFLSAKYLQDGDYAANVGHDSKGTYYKIDSDSAFSGRSVQPFGGTIQKHIDLLDNKHYNREIMRSMLQAFILPDSLLKAFVLSYTSSTHLFDIIKEQRDKYCVSIFMLNDYELRQEMFSSDFFEYCLSDAAADDLLAFKAYLSSFQTTQGEKLIDKCSDALSEIDTFFNNLKNLAVERIRNLLAKNAGATEIKDVVEKDKAIAKYVAENLGFDVESLFEKPEPKKKDEQDEKKTEAKPAFKLSDAQATALQSLKDYVQSLKDDNKISEKHYNAFKTAANASVFDPISLTSSCSKIYTSLRAKKELSCAKSLASLVFACTGIGLLFIYAFPATFLYKSVYKKEANDVKTFYETLRKAPARK